MEQPKEYYAFISYKREDKKEAKRLQHALEYYRLPNHLRQEKPVDGKVALERAFTQVKPEQEARLRIYPMSIEPRADLPIDMKDYYHFGEI